MLRPMPRFQFSLRWLLLLTAGMLAGGKTAHAIALSDKPMSGGAPISWSFRGEAIFFVIGCVAAVSVLAVLARLPSTLRWRAGDGLKRSAAMFIAAIAIGSISAAVAVLGLALVFFTMPHEIFDLLTQ